MTQKKYLSISLALLLILGNYPTHAGQIEPSAPNPNSAFNFRPMNEDEQNSAMCVLGAAGGMVASYVAGPSEVIMLVVGGLVVPSSSSILFWGLFGTIAAAGCTIGSLAAPATAWLYNQF